MANNVDAKVTVNLYQTKRGVKNGRHDLHFFSLNIHLKLAFKIFSNTIVRGCMSYERDHVPTLRKYDLQQFQNN